MSILVVLQLAFNAWMLVDAIRRRMDYYWFFIILMPLGCWIYFFVVKIHDYNLSSFKRLLTLENPASVNDLRATVEETPSLDNKLELANALLEEKEFSEAEALYLEILERDEEEVDAIYGLSLTRIATNESHAATTALARVIEADPSFRDWEAWFDLAYAHWQIERRDEAVAVLRRLVEKSPRIKHKVILGNYLARNGNKDDARTVLEEAVSDYKNATGFVKRHAGRWAREARTTLRSL
ncbi:MAG: tetratricopeptide repeat protein [Myxococcota bacterium]